MLLPFQDHLKNKFPHVRHSKILIAISGGLDSVVLAHLCSELKLHIALAHCNFNLRGKESDEDEAFVVELADHLEKEVFIESFETEVYARNQKISIQMAARELRYKWFEELKETLNYDYVFTAHHANDNLETVLINFVRGTGLEGLTGIPEQNGSILRPLLAFSRDDIAEYARNAHLKWREDSSNSSLKYLRNKIRQEVVPKLVELNPQLLDTFEATRNNLHESAVLVEDYISTLFPKIAKEDKFGYSFRIKLLKTIPHLKAVMYELFKSFGFTEWNDVYNLLDAQPGKIIYSKTHRLIKDRELLLLTTLPQPEEREFEILAGEEVVMLPMGTFQFEEVEVVAKAPENVIFLDQKKLQFPLTVRKWEQGDYFIPFGMNGKKKLSKFFKDEKLSLPEKENCWLLCSRDEIVWVIGYRADARFAIEDEASTILKLTYTA